MEGSIIGGPILSAPEAGVLELDPALNHHSLHHQQALSHHLQGLAPLSSTQHLNLGQDLDSSLGFDTSKSLLLCSKGKSAASSDDDEPSFTEDGDCHQGGKGKKSSPWQRMKWTDAMVKLLIHVVIFVGEDGTTEMGECIKKKAAGIWQKKGKWKSVSRVMNEKGCYVSPQQCEDKFNDLNKRYKRLNDILGKGIACCVVEDPSILDSMENIPPKAKDDVRKILSSKQLFYKEICAYHSGCKSLLPPADFELQRSAQLGNTGQSHDYLDMGRHHSGMDGVHDEDEDENDEGEKDDDDDDDDDDDYNEDRDIPHSQTDTGCGFSNDLFANQKKSLKQPDWQSSPFLKYTTAFSLDPSLNMDHPLTAQDGEKLTAEQQHTLFTRLLQLEEQKVGFLAQTLELERQRFKWERLNSKRYRELEQLRLDAKKLKLENERMSLTLKQKELEVEYKRSEASMSSIDIILERLHSKESINFVPGQSIE